MKSYSYQLKNALSLLIINQKMSFFFLIHEIKRDGITSFMEFHADQYTLGWFIFRKVLKVEPGGIPCCDK